MALKKSRYYKFSDTTVVEVENSGYLSPREIKDYEQKYGSLIFVKFMGRTILAK